MSELLGSQMSETQLQSYLEFRKKEKNISKDVNRLEELSIQLYSLKNFSFIHSFIHSSFVFSSSPLFFKAKISAAT